MGNKIRAVDEELKPRGSIVVMVESDGPKSNGKFCVV